METSPRRWSRPLAPLLVVALLAACGSPFTETPPVADSTFASALAGLHLAEARLRAQQEVQRPDTMRVPLSPAMRDSVLARHGIGYEAFRATLDYYVRHPEQYVAVYGQVVEALNVEQKALQFGETPRRPEQRVTPDAFQERARHEGE